MSKQDFLSEQEEKLLEVMSEGKSINVASKVLGLSYSTCRVRLHNIRVKYTRAVNTKTRIDIFKQKNPRMKFLLTPVRRENLE